VFFGWYSQFNSVEIGVGWIVQQEVLTPFHHLQQSIKSGKKWQLLPAEDIIPLLKWNKVVFGIRIVVLLLQEQDLFTLMWLKYQLCPFKTADGL